MKADDNHQMVADATVHTLTIPKALAEDEATYTIKFKDTDVKSSADLTIHGMCLLLN